jgi:cytosol alanyl aminopeptidase
MRRSLLLPRLMLAIAAIVPLAAASIAHSANRLPTDVVPTYQSVRLRIDADSTTYSGKVQIQLKVKKPTKIIQLYADGQNLTRVHLAHSYLDNYAHEFPTPPNPTGVRWKGDPTVKFTQSRGDRGLLTLTCDDELEKGAYSLEIVFTNKFNTQAVALYRMEREGLGYTFTQFEAEHAREAFPCFDEPSFKIPWRITVEIPERHVAISNMPVDWDKERSRGFKVVGFKETPPLPSYLIAIATGPLEFVPIPKTKVPIRIVTVKGQSALAGAAVETTPAILAALEKYFGQPYPFPKLDLLAVPEYWAGAMENPGAITYSDNILLGDPKIVSSAHRRTLLRVTSHELAHMWFGDLVTMAWWDDLWLNESFADWLGDRIADRMAPELKHLLAEGQSVQDIMEADARPSTEPIRLHAETGDQAMHAVQIAYNKGKAVLGMFEQWMGPEAFQKGVKSYLHEHEWGNAVAADLWKSLGKASGKDVESMMGAFIEQPGLPLVTVKALADGTLELTQRRFLNYGVKADPVSWKIPMTIAYSDGHTVRRTSIVLGAERQIVKLEAPSPVWVMPNVGARGYFRWSVPQEMLDAIARDAAASLDPAERIAFIGNLTALLDAGEIHGDLYLKTLGAMAKDPEPFVVSAVLSGLDKAKFAFVPDDLKDPFAAYVRRTLEPAVRRFGLEKQASEDPTVALMRPRLLTWMGREGRDPAALAIAKTIAAQHLADPASVDASVAPVALQLNAIGGDHALYDRYRTAFEQASDPSIRQRYLMALGCFDDPTLEAEAMRYGLEGPVRPNELAWIPRSIAVRSEAAADRVFAFQREHYEQIAAKLPREFRSFLAGAGAGCSAERYAIAKTFYSDPSRAVPGTDRQLAKVGDLVGDCVSLRQREGPAVAAYLRGLVGAN